MKITMTEEHGVVILTLQERMGLSGGSALKDMVSASIEKDKVSFHLNFWKVEFINSSGLGCLVAILKEIRRRKGRLTLSDLAPYVREIFEITQLSHIFEIFPTQKEALDSYPTGD
jgi:anti-anti-sigma factor